MKLALISDKKPKKNEQEEGESNESQVAQNDSGSGE
jgi:hypothetical protein